MKRLSGLRDLGREGGLSLAWILTVAALPLGLVVAINRLNQVSFYYLMADPAVVFSGRFYAGFLSQLGIFCWVAAATVCLFTAYLLRQNGASIKTRRFLWFSGWLSLGLGLDDAFLIHEDLMPNYLGIPEVLVYAAYGGLMLAYLVGFWALIRATKFTLLGWALLAFAVSIGMDGVNGTDPNIYFVEDGVKFVGLVAWLSYYVRTAARFAYPVPLSGSALQFGKNEPMRAVVRR